MKKIISLICIISLLLVTVSVSASPLFGENITQFKSFATNGSSVTVSCTDGAVFVSGGVGAVKTIGFNPDGTSSTNFVPINGLSSVFKLASGKNHTLAVTTSGKLYAWGDNTYGQLGLGNTDSSSVPVHVSSITGNVIDVAAGENCSFAITYDGSVYVWGNNEFGQLGDGTTENKLLPTKITTPSKIALVASGYGQTVMLSTIGKAFVCGKNDFGQLGLGNTENVSTLTPAPGFDGAVMYALGDGFSVSLSSSGVVYVCGKNDMGQLGLSNADNVLTPTHLPSVSGIYYIAAGANHVIAASTAGGIYTWGDNTYGQLGRDGDSTVPARTSLSTSVTAIAAGDHSSAVVTVAGVLNLCGNFESAEALSTETVPEEKPELIKPVTEKPAEVTDIGLYVNGNWIITDVPPMIKDDRTLVPVRGIFEALSINVEWDGETRTVTAVSQDGATSVSLKIGEKIALVNGAETEIDVPAQIINDRTMVPVRFIAQSLGCNVGWDGALRTVIVTSK